MIVLHEDTRTVSREDCVQEKELFSRTIAGGRGTEGGNSEGGKEGGNGSEMRHCVTIEKVEMGGTTRKGARDARK